MRALEILENRLTVFSNSSLRSPIYRLTLLSFCQLTSGFSGAKAFKRSEKLSRWPSRGRPPLLAGRTNLMMVEGLQKTPAVELDGPWRSWYTGQSTQPIPLRLFSSSLARHFFFSTFKLLITCLPWRAITASLTDPQYLYKLRRLARSQTPGAEPPPPDENNEKLLNFTVSPVPPHAE